MTLNTQMPLIHVCFCANGGDNVAELIENRSQQRLVLFYDTLDLGPLKDIHLAYANSPRDIYFNKTCSYFPVAESNQDSESDLNLFGVQVLFPPPAPSQTVLVWTGQSTNEQMMLRAVCAYWLETDLWLADVRRLKPWFPNNFPYVPSFTPQALAKLEGMSERMKPEHKRELADEWHELTRQDHVVRIYQDAKILGVEEDFFDAFLLESCTKEWQFQARVAGNCQANSGYSSVGDVFLFYRLELMAQRGLVEFQRNQYGDFRHDKVRKL